MRTLKKVLALSLVCAMAFTMMAGAAFGDQDKINSDLSSDIELMTALGVFKGDENGNFNPTESVTRAQAAKMIYVLKNNGNDDGATAFTGASVYADVATGFWGDGYITYCTNSGFMGGWAQNGVRMFDPNAAVTGQEMAKMLLCLVGYKADVQGYVGDGWAAKVGTDALEAGIFMDYTPVVTQAAPREWTARLLSNAINAYQVSYGKDGLVVGDKTYAEKTLKLTSVVGELQKTKTTQIVKAGANPAIPPATANKSQLVNVTPDQIGNVATMSFNFDAPASLLGQNVKVYYKEGNTKGLENATKVYSVMPSDSKVYNVNLFDVKVDGTKVSFPGFSAVDQAQKDLNPTEPAKISTITPVYNYVTSSPVNVVTTGSGATEVTASQVLKNLGLGQNINEKVRIVTDADGMITKIFFTNATYAVVDKIDTAKQSFKVVDADGKQITMHANGVVGNAALTDGTALGNGALAIGTTEDGKKAYAQLNFIDTLAKDDVVSITPNFTTGKMIYDIKKLPVVTGKVTSFGVGTSAYSALSIDGTEYKVSAQKLAAYEFSTGSNDTVNAKDATSFYTDGKYLVYANGDKASSVFTKNFAYVIGAANGTTGLGGSDAKVQLLFADNTIKTYNYTASADVPSKGITLTETNGHIAAGAAADKTKVQLENVYEYVIEENGTVYLKALDSVGNTKVVDTANVLSYTKADQMFKDGTTSLARLGTDTVVFSKYDADGKTATKDDIKYAAVKGSELNYNINTTVDGDIVNANTDGKHVAYTTASGLPVMIYGTVNYNTASLPSDVSDDKFAIMTSTTTMAGDIDKNNVLVTANAVVNGSETQLKFKVNKDSVATTMSTLNGYRNHLITYVMKGEYADVTATPKVTTDPAGDKKWTKVSVEGFNAGAIYGADMDDNGASVFYNITDKTKVMYVDASGSNIVAVTDGSMAKANDPAVVNGVTQPKIANAVIYGVKNADGGSTLNASVIVIEVNGNDISKVVA